MSTVYRGGGAGSKYLGNANPNEVLSGKTYHKNTKELLTGTMSNNGAITHQLSINGEYTIPQGYHNGIGKVSQSVPTKGAQTYIPGTTDQEIAAGQYLSGKQIIKGDADLIPANIKAGVDIFGKVGTLVPITDISGAMKTGTVKTDNTILAGDKIDLELNIPIKSTAADNSASYFQSIIVQVTDTMAVRIVGYVTDPTFQVINCVGGTYTYSTPQQLGIPGTVHCAIRASDNSILAFYQPTSSANPSAIILIGLTSTGVTKITTTLITIFSSLVSSCRFVDFDSNRVLFLAWSENTYLSTWIISFTSSTVTLGARADNNSTQFRFSICGQLVLSSGSDNYFAIVGSAANSNQAFQNVKVSGSTITVIAYSASDLFLSGSSRAISMIASGFNDGKFSVVNGYLAVDGTVTTGTIQFPATARSVLSGIVGIAPTFSSLLESYQQFIQLNRYTCLVATKRSGVIHVSVVGWLNKGALLTEIYYGTVNVPSTRTAVQLALFNTQKEFLIATGSTTNWYDYATLLDWVISKNISEILFKGIALTSGNAGQSINYK